MTHRSTRSSRSMTIAAVTRARPGEAQNGDGFAVGFESRDGGPWQMHLSQRVRLREAGVTYHQRLTDERAVWLAVVDGIGHGPEAAAATRAVFESLEYPLLRNLVSLIERCHQRLASTRGVTMGAALIDLEGEVVSFAGIGNTRAYVCRRNGSGALAPEVTELTSGAGIVGHNLPLRLDQETCRFSEGDTLFMCTDGIDDRVREGVLERIGGTGAVSIAEAAYALSGRAEDDATLIVATAF